VDGIRVRDIHKRFRSVQALDGVSLDVEPGEVVALLGPNGAGKSTLMRILGTTVLPDSGSATVGGHDVVAEPAAARRSLGLMIGDERSHYWRLSGLRNLAFFAVLAGMSRRTAVAQAERLLGAVGLAEAADRPVRGYSAGMRNRLSLARAMLGEPPVLILDEPTRNLDPLAASRFRKTASTLAGTHGTGVLFATHDLHEAAMLATRVLVMSRGRIVLVEPAVELDTARLEAAFLAAVRKQGQDDAIPADETVVEA
jgi:ABC-2 type transport system ATP-binding protein